MRRRFNGRERVALYLAAGGKCTRCGDELEPGWHGDHVEPWSKGGNTDVLNGQALCPKCNLEKGDKIVTELRSWQRRAIEDFYASDKRDFVVSATPGAGKTAFALSLAKRLVDEGSVRRVVVVVPTDALRQQWADVAESFGLSLMPASAAEDYEKSGYQGCVATYAQIAKGVGTELLRRSMRIPTLAILDEIHHAGESKAWGDGLRYAVDQASYRLSLTGTPWRRDDSSPIPFVSYDDYGKVIVDHAYEYGAAVADGVCRRVEFHTYDGEARWTDCGKVESASLGKDLSDEDVSIVLDAFYRPDLNWMPVILANANRALDEVCEDVPDAGGLVIAERKWHAHEYARILEGITGTKPAVVVSDDPLAKDKIDRFRNSRDRWLVAVRMVSEGVDIPRLAVGVYASKIRTPLFFRQVVGRFVRTRLGEEMNALLFMPAVPALSTHAREIEQELRHQLDLEAERERIERKIPTDVDGQDRFDLREPLSASGAVFDSAILAGDASTSVEYTEARAKCRELGIPERFAMNLLPLMRPGIEVKPVVIPTTDQSPRHRREAMLRQEAKVLGNRLAYRGGVEQRQVNADLLRAGFPPRAKASLEDLEKIVHQLAQWLGDV